MPELLPENNHPLNQAAKRLLGEAKADADPDALYVAQLMQWSLDQGKDDLVPKFRDQIADAVQVIMGADPQRAMKYLLVPPGAESQDEEILSLESVEGRSPAEAAQELLLALHSQLSERNPAYNPP